MFGQVLDKLDTYFGRAFLLARYVPWLLCLAANLFIAAIEFPSFRARLLHVATNLSGENAVAFVLILLAVWVVAYGSSPGFRFVVDLLEGHHLPRPLRRLFAATHAARRERLERSDSESFKNLADAGLVDKLFDSLKESHRHGRQWRSIRDPAAIDAAACAVNSLLRAREGIQPIALHDLQRAVDLLAKALRENCSDPRRLVDVARGGQVKFRVRLWWFLAAVIRFVARRSRVIDARAENEQWRAAALLASLYRALWSQVMPYARAVAEELDQRIVVERHNRFAAHVLAPTALGNEAAAMRNYCATRYGIDFDFFWPRFLLVVRNDPKLADALSTAKIQLDFSVAAFTLSTVSLLAWAGVLAVQGTSPLSAGVVVGLGPLVVWGWLGIVHASYGEFAEVVRAAIDLRRFDVLAALRYALPSSAAQEKRCWVAVQRLSLFDEHAANAALRHP